MKSLLVVQHCQSEHHINGMTGGWTDTPLTDLGRRQATAVASRLKREAASACCCQIWSSDLQRAVQTADAIGNNLGVTVSHAAELREFNNGVAAGMRREEAKKIEIGTRIASIDRQPFAEAETWRRFYHRVAGFMDRLSRDEDDQTIVVTHGGSVINIIAWWLRLDVEMLARVSFGTAPGGITRLTTNQWGERVLQVLSDTSHLVGLA